MRGGAILGILLLAGCNAVFGLEPTISIDGGDADFDLDGIVDAVDNCPALANKDQANADGDGFGDACDTCPMFASASSHDEDGDHLGDDCDRCPGVSDFQDDIDNDGIGDLCDPTPDKTPEHRVLFEGFAVLSASWQPDGVGWTGTQDSVAPVANLPPGDVGLRDVDVTVTGSWTALIGVESMSRWMEGDKLGITWRASGSTTSCYASCSAAGTCFGTFEVDGAPMLISAGYIPRPYARMAVVASPGTATCLFEGGGALSASAVTEPATLSVLGSPRAHVAYFELLQ